jgi:hypothetical protein
MVFCPSCDGVSLKFKKTNTFKGIVQQILTGVNKLKKYALVNWRPGHFSFWNFKGTLSQEKQKTIFSGLKICRMALSNQINFSSFFSLHKMTYRSFINSEYDNLLSPLPHKMALRRHVLEN